MTGERSDSQHDGRESNTAQIGKEDHYSKIAFWLREVAHERKTWESGNTQSEKTIAVV